MGISEFIDRIEEGQDLTIVLQESDHRFIESRQLLIRLITAWVMGATTVEDITATVATLILGDALTVRKTIDPHHQRSLGIVLRERSRTVLRMGFIRIQVCCLITVGSTGDRLNLLELWQFGQLSEDFHQVGIMEDRRTGQQFAQVLDCRRDRLDEVLLLLEVTTETVSAQHL